LPHPALSTIAARMGKTVRQMQQYVHHLRGAGMLVVVERRDARGAQLTNAYDVRPFLRAVETLDRQAAGVSGAQGPAAGSLKSASPKRDTEQKDLDLDSMPPTPRCVSSTQPPCHAHEAQPRLATAAAPNSHGGTIAAHVMLRDRMIRLAQTLGDAAPSSSIARVERLLQQSGLSEAAFCAVLDRAEQRVRGQRPAIRHQLPDGGTNAMPYLLATVGALLHESRGAPRPKSRTGRPSWPHAEAPVGRPGAARISPRSAPTPRDSPSLPPASAPASRDPASPLWSEVLAALQPTLAPRIYERWLSPVHAGIDPDGVLVLAAPMPFHRDWLERVLRRPLLQALAALGRPDQAIRFVVQRE
jgi:hypothetical protein